MSRRRRRDRNATQLPELSGRTFPERESTDVWPSEPSFVGSTGQVLRPFHGVESLVGVWGELAPYRLSPPIAVLRTLRPIGRRNRVNHQAAPASFLSKQFNARSFNVLRVQAPKRVRFCVQRKSRRGVLFAHSLVGFSGSSPGKNGRYRQSKFSEYRC